VSGAARELDLDAASGEVAAALAAVAEAWDAEWAPARDGGRLTLPVVHGLRRGVETGEVRLTRLGEARTRLAWTLHDSRLEVDRASVTVLSFAAVPLVVTVAWPFWPALFALVPFAAVTGLVAWWLVVSRLRSRGPEEFFAELARALAAADEAPSPGNPPTP